MAYTDLTPAQWAILGCCITLYFILYHEMGGAYTANNWRHFLFNVRCWVLAMIVSICVGATLTVIL